jgi:hypothetical protein
MKNQVHGTLVYHAGIFQPKGHYHPFEQSNETRAVEKCFANVSFGHENMIVSYVTIQKTPDPVP